MIVFLNIRALLTLGILEGILSGKSVTYPFNILTHGRLRRLKRDLAALIGGGQFNHVSFSQFSLERVVGLQQHLIN